MATNLYCFCICHNSVNGNVNVSVSQNLIFRILVKRSTVHNNGDVDVNVRNDVKRTRKMSGSLTSSLTSTNLHREFYARAGAVTVHTTLTAVRVTFR
jgi:hypothetical protein